MEDIKVKKFGPSCGKHGSSVFYKAFKYKKDGKSKIITLGQFFFMKILDSIPICIGELQLVWEDKNSSTDLISVRLYFLPECTPEGRQPNHGEDEVLAYYEKIVLKLSDLASMIVHDVSWSEGRRAFTAGPEQEDSEYGSLAEAFTMNSYGLDNRDIEKEKQDAEANESLEDSSPDVVIMTYPRYCRYRCMLKRLENCEDKWLRHALVCALGGFSAKLENNRVYFCKDIFEHADLDDFELRCDHLAPNLIGRPRKKKGSKRDVSDSSEESSCSSGFSPQPEPAQNKVRIGSRATPLRNGFRIDKIKVSKDEQAFLIDLHKFMKSRNTPIGRIPSLGFKQIDLFQFYCLAEEIGGYDQISNKRMWKHLYDKLGGNPGFTSAATCTRRHYEKLLLPYEQYKNGQEMRYLQQKKKKVKSESDIVSLKKTNIEPILKEEITSIKNEENSFFTKEQFKEKTESSSDNSRWNPDVKPVMNGKPENGNIMKLEKEDTAAIIKREIEKMKMRKAARKHGTSILTKPKDTGTNNKKKPLEGDGLRKQRLGDKGRRPSGSQKTVRELLHQNGQDSSDIAYDKPNDKANDPNIMKSSIKTEDIHIHHPVDDRKKKDMNETNSSQSLPATVSHIDTKSMMTQNFIPNFTQAQPMFYPQIIPVAGGMRNMAPMAMQFMIPQFGFQTLPNTMQGMPALANVHGVKEEKPLHALNKLVSDQSVQPLSSRVAISSHHSRSTPSIVTPPSAHSSSHLSSKGSSLPTHSISQAHRPIAPAHSHSNKRIYPYSDTNKSHITQTSSTSPYSSRDLKSEPVDLKKQKLNNAQDDSYQPSNEFDAPVLDLSMKTLRAQEARHHRGESLLFNTSFNKENSKSVPKSEHYDGPQDLSLKPRTSTSGGPFGNDRPKACATSGSTNSDRPSSVHKSVPLNIPYPRIPTSSPSVKKEDDTRKPRMDFQPPVSSKPILPVSSSGISSAGITTIGGFPIDIGSFVHPAFPQQMLMQGVFPTPLQLQQMIQGQVAAGMPMLRPEFIPSSFMFPPNMSVMAPTMFSSVLPTVAKNNTNSANAVKR